MSERQHRSRQWWTAAVENTRTSTLNERDFALSIGAHPATLAWWRRKLAKEAAGGVPRLVRIDVTQPHESTYRFALEAAVGPIAVRFAVGTDPAYLSELLASISRTVA